MPIKQAAKSIARAVLHQGGGLRAVRAWNRSAFRILMYHHFPPIPEMKESLARQCEHINRYYHVVTMSDIARHLKDRSPLPENALAVTIDDGSRDFMLNGFPVFKAHGISTTVYIVSGFVDKKLWMWWDQVDFLVRESPLTSFQLSLSSVGNPIKFTIGTPEERAQAGEMIKEALKKVREAEKLEILKQLPRILELELPREPPPHLAPLDWKEVRQLSQDGVEIGAHTVTHPILSRITDQVELLAEIGNSKKRIEEELARPVKHFCYPYGLWEHVSQQAVHTVEECHFETAVLAEPGLNSRGTHPLTLKRISMEALTPEYYFQESLVGLHC